MCSEVCRFSDLLRRESFAHLTRDGSVLTLVEGGASKKQGVSVTCLGGGGIGEYLAIVRTEIQVLRR